MNLKVVSRLVMVLAISQLRATRSRNERLDFLRRPSAIIVIDVIAFVGAFILVGRFASSMTPHIQLSIVQSVASIPMFLVFFVMLSGLLWEISYSFTFTSTDMINYLPISAAEYVLASSISIVFSYSIFLAGALGANLALSVQIGLVSVWPAMAGMSLVAMFIGAFGVEVLRAFTNRASSLLYKRSGRPVLMLRMIVLITVLVFFQVAFNPRFILIILETVSGGGGAWYFPPAWPSLALTGFLESDLTSAFSYTILTLALVVTLFYTGKRLRQVYWMPIPVSVRLSTSAYAPRIGLLNRLGLNSAEAAIARKDFRSLTRRREMARILAFPILIAVSIMIPSLTSTGGTPPLLSGVMFWAFPLLSGITLFVLMYSITSIGQEGYSVWNLCVSSVSPSELVKAKTSASIILSLPIAFLFWLGITILDHPSFKASIAFLLVLASLVSVESLLGLMMGAKFPDFSETIRSRFISIFGMLVSMLLGAAAAGVILAPYGLYLFLRLPWLNKDFYFILASLAMLTLAILISVVAHRSCISMAKKLLRELPI